MEIKVDVSTYDVNTGIADQWVDGYQIDVKVENGEVVILGNSAGLKSLALQLLALSQENVPVGYHLHFSQAYGLEDGSNDLLLGKM